MFLHGIGQFAFLALYFTQDCAGFQPANVCMQRVSFSCGFAHDLCSVGFPVIFLQFHLGVYNKYVTGETGDGLLSSVLIAFHILWVNF